jgi:restriction system protein
MVEMLHIIETLNTHITAPQFDRLISNYVYDLFKDFNRFKLEKSVEIAYSNTEYQINIKVSYELIGVQLQIPIECYKQSEKLDINTVQKFYAKMKLIRAKKGMLFSSSGFTYDAYNYAKNNGIALIKIVEGKYTYNLRSFAAPNFVMPDWVDTPEFAGEFKHVCQRTNKDTMAFIQEEYMEPLLDFILR